MKESTFSLITFVSTIGGGLILFIISQIALKVVIEPVVELKKVIGKIARTLLVYANMYHNPAELTDINLSNEKLASERNRVGSEIRVLAGACWDPYKLYLMYRIFSLLRVVSSLKRIETARRNLTGLSNSLWKTHADDYIFGHVIVTEREILDALCIKAFR